MSKQKLDQSLRLERKRQRLGEGARCQICGQTDIRVLELSRERVLCSECRHEVQGKPPVEKHHPAGRNNDSFYVPLPANDHAILTDCQNDWPTETLTNPSPDILHQIAAWLRAISDTLKHLAEMVEKWAKTLEELARYLATQIGLDWWQRFLEWIGAQAA